MEWKTLLRHKFFKSRNNCFPKALQASQSIQIYNVMNMRRFSIPAFALLFLMMASSVHAQFEGQVTMKVYNTDNGQVKTNEINLYATANRIMIKGEEQFDIMDNMTTDGLLIRNDQKDFILMTGENEALQVSKVEIEGMVEMLSSWSGESSSGSSNSSKTKYRFSDRQMTVLGFEAAEMIVQDTEDPDKHLSIWLTPDIKINWGMLGERWNNMPESIDREINGVAKEVIFTGQNFPLMIEAVDGQSRTTIMEVSSVNESSVAKAMVELASGVSLMSFKDYVFRMMMQQ